jgi:hypothetical protein
VSGGAATTSTTSAERRRRAFFGVSALRFAAGAALTPNSRRSVATRAANASPASCGTKDSRRGGVHLNLAQRARLGP